MVNTIFDSILNGRPYHVDVKIVKSILQNMGYEIGHSQFGLTAIKWVSSQRYHFTISQLPDEEIDKCCSIDFHKDNGVRLFHTSISNDDEIQTEFQLFKDELFKILRNKRRNKKMRERKERKKIEREERRQKYKEKYNHMFRWM